MVEKMNNSNLLIFVDIDATISHVGDRFTAHPPPVEKNRHNPVYQQWLIDVQAPELLAKDTPVPGMQQFVEAFPNAIYLTSRSEIHKEDTLKWLRIHHFPPRGLTMRVEGDLRHYYDFKEDAINYMLKQRADQDNSDINAYNVIIVDDDPKGELEKLCIRNGWVHLRATSGGVVL